MRSLVVAAVVGLSILATAGSALGAAGGHKETCATGVVHGVHVIALHTAGGLSCGLAHQHVDTYLGSRPHLLHGYYCSARPSSGHTEVDCVAHNGGHSFTLVYRH